MLARISRVSTVSAAVVAECKRSSLLIVARNGRFMHRLLGRRLEEGQKRYFDRNSQVGLLYLQHSF